jgi:hypothetical protein
LKYYFKGEKKMIAISKTVVIRDLVIFIAILGIVNTALTQLFSVLPQYAVYISTALTVVVALVYYGNQILVLLNNLPDMLTAELKK